jgi:hypothetical protein
MSATVLPLDGDPHQAVQALLPWYVNGRLEADEAARVEDHLAACAVCRLGLDWERRISQLPWPVASASGEPLPDPERGLERLHQRIWAEDAVDREDRSAWRPKAARRRVPGGVLPGAASPGQAWLAGESWLRWLLGTLVGGQFAAIVVLVALLVHPAVRPGVSAESAAAYHALGNPPPATPGNAIIRFRPAATERDIRLALQVAGARLVDGPTANAAYVLELPAGHQAAALAALRAHPQVTMAESLVSTAEP